MTLDVGCSAILQKHLLSKIKDLRSFTIPCLIGGLEVEKALADSDASINVMPYKFFKKIGLREPRPTWMILQLTERLVRHLRGIVEDVLVKVDKNIYPMDFVVLHVVDDVETLLAHFKSSHPYGQWRDDIKGQR